MRSTKNAKDTKDTKNSSQSFPDLSLKAPKGIADILLSIRKVDNSPIVTTEEATNLANLKFKNGEPILNMQHRWFVYEIVWLLTVVGYTPTYNYLSMDWEKIFGEYNIRKKMMFENPLMSPAKEKFAVDMEIYRNKPELVEGGEKCRRCQSEATVSTEMQKRRCDENVNIIIWCSSCGYKWTAQ
jgi:DNA-directed RNA polymerase subunit M/transcription elongation factor TFIIS